MPLTSLEKKVALARLQLLTQLLRTAHAELRSDNEAECQSALNEASAIFKSTRAIFLLGQRNDFSMLDTTQEQHTYSGTLQVTPGDRGISVPVNSDSSDVN